MQHRTALLLFPNQLGAINSEHIINDAWVINDAWEFVMVIRISFGVLIATSLALSTYFGATAWRLTNDLQNDGVGWNSPFKPGGRP
jgi:hypothetical protein